MERTQNEWRSFTQDEYQKIIIKYYQKRKCQYFGPMIRGDDGVQRLLMEGRINGRRGRGGGRETENNVDGLHQGMDKNII